MKRQYRTIALLPLLLLLLQGCDKHVYYTDEHDVDETGWNMNDAAVFDVDVDDTLQVFDFFIDVRNSVHFPKANVFFFINTTFPDGSVAYDTLECPLADVEGHWYGVCTALRSSTVCATPTWWG